MQRLSGIVTTGAQSTDAALVLMPIDSVREVIGYDAEESTQVAIFLNNGRRTLTVSQRMKQLVGQDAAVLTWDELQPEIKTFIAMKKGGGIVMNIVIGLLVAAGIFNTIFMSVMERTREFGIMLAIGYAPRQLFALVMAESFLLANLGLGLCVAMTSPLYWYLSKNGLDLTEAYAEQGMDTMDIGGVGFDPILPFGIFPESGVAIAGAIFLSTMLAGLYPAWKAGRVDPVESINLV